jgi:hypothetical protein
VCLITTFELSTQDRAYLTRRSLWLCAVAACPTFTIPLPPPQANASALVGNRLSLLLDDDLDEVAAAALRLAELLPHITVDKFVEYYPQVLDIDDFELALQVRQTQGRNAL